MARSHPLILDEVQRSLDLLIAVKRALDKERGRTPVRFFLTGSANLLMLKRIGGTLTGHAVYASRSGRSP